VVLHESRIQAIVMVPAAAFLPKGLESVSILGSKGAAERRDPAKFRGLLRAGRNRKNESSDCSRLCRNQVRTSNFAGETALMIRRLMVPLTLALLASLAAAADRAGAQGAFPAPLPGQMNQPPANDPAFPPVNGRPTPSVGAAPTSAFPSGGAAPIGGMGGGGGSAFNTPQAPQGGPPADCMKGFMPLREDAEKKGKLIKAASERRAPPDEACKLISSYSQAEVKMIKYVESHAASCGIPPQIADQLKGGHKGTEALEKKVCAVAQQQAQGGGPAAAGPSLSEVLGSSAALPEANKMKKGGSTFDTLNGNVLSR
jgi:hypothetical protein